MESLKSLLIHCQSDAHRVPSGSPSAGQMFAMMHHAAARLTLLQTTCAGAKGSICTVSPSMACLPIFTTPSHALPRLCQCTSSTRLGVSSTPSEPKNSTCYPRETFLHCLKAHELHFVRHMSIVSGPLPCTKSHVNPRHCKRIGTALTSMYIIKHAFKGKRGYTRSACHAWKSPHLRIVPVSALASLQSFELCCAG